MEPPPPGTFEALANACRPYVPNTVALLTQGLIKARRGQAAALAALFEAPGRLRQETGRLCVILLDEFHRLSAWGTVKPYAALSRQVVVQQDTMYILASSSVEEARRILQEQLALLFGHFEVIPVEPFDLAAGVQFLAERAGVSGIGLPTLIALADVAEGQPAVLEQMARAIRASDRAGDEAAIAALTALLFRADGTLARQCLEAVAPLPETRRLAALTVLSAIAQGHHRVNAIAAAVGSPAAQVARLVRVLTDAGLVTRQGVFCGVRSRLVSLWMQSSYRIQQGPVHLEPPVAEQAFAEAMRQWLRQATSRAPQAVLETVADLMRRFQNEMVEIHGRRVRLPKLDVHTLLMPGAPRAVVGQHDEARWLCVPHTTTVKEADAVGLIQALGHAATPWTRRIIMAVEGLEVNARLLLQEHKFWVWELEELNRVLDLYGVPRLLPTALQSLATVAEMPKPPEALDERQRAGAL